MNRDDPIDLDDNPAVAFREIAGYLRSINMTNERVHIDKPFGEVVGYWQSPEYLQGLLDIANECIRHAEQLEQQGDQVARSNSSQGCAGRIEPVTKAVGADYYVNGQKVDRE
nr:hypothetical protein 2 [Pseudomonadaceae bacterium]